MHKQTFSLFHLVTGDCQAYADRALMFCWWWKQFDAQVSDSISLTLPPRLLLSVFLPANSSLVTPSTTWSGSQSQTREDRRPLIGSEGASSCCNLTPETPLKSVCSENVDLFHTSHLHTQHAEKIKIITHSLLLSGLPRCKISTLKVTIFYASTCPDRDGEMSLPTMRG